MAYKLQKLDMLNEINSDNKILIQWGFFALIEFLISESDKILKNSVNALDIGSSHGNHTKLMRDFGLKVDQIDKYEKSAEINDDFNSYDFKKRYDVIFCSHVIEHQRNIGYFLDKIFDTLSNEGSLVISAPKHPAERFVEGHLHSTIMPILLQNLIFSGFDCLNGKVLSMAGIENSFIVKKSKNFNLEEREKNNYQWNIKHQKRSFFRLNDQSLIKNTSLFIKNCEVWKLEDLITIKITEEGKKDIALSLNFPEEYKHRNLMIDFIINHNEFPFWIIDNNKNILNDKSKKIVNFKV